MLEVVGGLGVTPVDPGLGHVAVDVESFLHCFEFLFSSLRQNSSAKHDLLKARFVHSRHKINLCQWIPAHSLRLSVCLIISILARRLLVRRQFPKGVNDPLGQVSLQVVGLDSVGHLRSLGTRRSSFRSLLKVLLVELVEMVGYYSLAEGDVLVVILGVDDPSLQLRLSLKLGIGFVELIKLALGRQIPAGWWMLHIYNFVKNKFEFKIF